MYLGYYFLTVPEKDLCVITFTGILLSGISSKLLHSLIAPTKSQENKNIQEELKRF